MNKVKLLLVFFIVAIFTLGFNSCAKEEVTSEAEGVVETRATVIPEGTTMPIIRLMPTVVSGILKFNSKQHLSEFWEDIETSDDDQLNLLEQTLGFVSLRSKYNDAEGNSLIVPAFPFVINNPFDAMVFNQHHELWVGTDIYKLVDKRLVVRANSAYVSEVLSLRDNNGIVREHTELIDRNTKEILPEPKVSTRTKCTMSITVPFNPTATNGGNSVYGYIQPVVINTNGNKVTTCGGSISIAWGDGTTSGDPNGNINAVRNHIYNVGPGECKTFKVKVTLNLTLCGECTGTLVTEQSITICSPVSCTSHEHETGEQLVLDQVYGGAQNNDFRAFFIMGYDSDDYLWHDARAWGHIKFFEKTIFGGGVVLYTAITKKVNSRIFIHGAVFEESCTGNRIAVNANSGIKNKKREHRFMWKLDDVNFRLRSDDDLYCDFEVFNTNNFNSPDISLYNRRYSNL